jgi:hypothetical protein
MQGLTRGAQLRHVWLLVLVAVALMVPRGHAETQPAPASPGTLHAILVADTDDAKIGRGTKANLDRMTSLLRQASKGGGFPLTLSVVSGKDFSCRAILAALEGLKAGPQDTALFYIAAHGYRTAATATRFPDFYCIKPGDTRGTIVGTALVEQRLKQSGARFRIAIADTCNVTLGGDLRETGTGRSLTDVDPRVWNRLFQRYSGTILMSGSAAGKPSWYFNSGRRVGGMFTNQFFGAFEKTLDDAARNPELARWSTIVNRATVPIVYSSTVGQEPQGERRGLKVDPLPLVTSGN